MKFLIFLFLIIVGVSFSSPIKKVSEITLFNGEKLIEYRLENGLKAIFVPRTKASVVTFQVWFMAGSLTERLDPKLNTTGLAHLFEHMMFRGSKKYPDGKFEEITASLGAVGQNATTSFSRTNYYESVPSKHLETIMSLESDRMRNLNLTDDIFNKEKGAVIGEYRMGLDRPTTVAWDELNLLMFDKLPFRYGIIGVENDIKNFSKESAQYYYETYYAPNNCLIIVVGEVEEEKLQELLIKYYAPMKSKVIKAYPLPSEPKQKKEKKVVKTHKQATSELLLIGYNSAPINSPELAPLSLLSTYLSTGMEARLRKLLVDRHIAVSAIANVDNSPDRFTFWIYLAQNKKAKDALSIIDREIKRLKTFTIDNNSFERVKNQELLSLYGGINDNSSLASWFGELYALCGNYMRGFEIIEQYKKLTPKDLKAVVLKYLNNNNRSIVIIKPEKT